MRRLILSVGAVLLLVASSPAIAQDAAGPTVTQHVVPSFDGTPIVTTLFLPPGASASSPVPLVLETHGWAGTGRKTPGGLPARLLDEGYAVLTWDQRGFGCSGGEVRIDDPDVEGRDVSALIDWAVGHAPVRLVDGDPVVGMIGGSYAGGIQTATAAIDPRLDAIAPQISWGDLAYSLFPGQVVKQGWAAILYGAGVATAEGQGLAPNCPAGPQRGGLDPAIHQAINEVATTGSVSDATLDFFAKSSLVHYGRQRPVRIPTLVANGSVDTLFNLSDGLKVHQHALAHGAESRYLLFCGGHVSCPSTYADADDERHLQDAVLAWFARHLKGESVDTGAPVEYRTNAGVWRSLPAYPGTDAAQLSVEGDAQGLLIVPVLDVPDVSSSIAQFQSDGGTVPPNPVVAASAAMPGDPRSATFEVGQVTGGPLDIVGTPTVTLTVSGQDAAPDSVNLFVKLVHRESGAVLNLQEGAVRATLAGGTTTVDVPMPGLAYTIPDGHHLDLEVSTASLMHATGRVPGTVDVGVRASVPFVRAPATPAEVQRSAPDSLPATGGKPATFALVLLAAGLLVARPLRSVRAGRLP